MKKIASLVTAAMVVCSLTGCAYRNNTARNIQDTNRNLGINGQNNVMPGGATGTSQSASTVRYKDGTYTGVGNRSSAVVVINKEVIASIDLYDTVNGTGTGNTSSNNGNRVNNFVDTNNGSNEYGAGTNNARNVTGTNPNGTLSGALGMNGTNPGNTGSASGYSTTGGNTGSNTGNGVTGNGNTNVGMTSDTVKRNVIDNVMKYQSADVSITGTDATATDDYMLAIRRALEKARK